MYDVVNKVIWKWAARVWKRNLKSMMMRKNYLKLLLTKERKKYWYVCWRKTIDLDKKINKVAYFYPAILSGRGKIFMQVVWITKDQQFQAETQFKHSKSGWTRSSSSLDALVTWGNLRMKWLEVSISRSKVIRKWLPLILLNIVSCSQWFCSSIQTQRSYVVQQISL